MSDRSRVAVILGGHTRARQMRNECKCKGKLKRFRFVVKRRPVECNCQCKFKRRRIVVKRPSAGSSTRPPRLGPRSLAEIDGMLSAWVRELPDDYRDRLAAHFGQGVTLSTDYSGSGQAERVAHDLHVATQAALCAECPAVGILRSCDVDGHCRQILETMNVGCVFGDMTERLPQTVRVALGKLCERSNAEYRDSLAAKGKAANISDWARDDVETQGPQVFGVASGFKLPEETQRAEGAGGGGVSGQIAWAPVSYTILADSGRGRFRTESSRDRWGGGLGLVWVSGTLNLLRLVFSCASSRGLTIRLRARVPH